jgi:hypothetical protein
MRRYYRLFVLAAPGSDLLPLRDELRKLAGPGLGLVVHDSGWPTCPWGLHIDSEDGRLLRHIERKLKGWPNLEVRFRYL